MMTKMAEPVLPRVPSPRPNGQALWQTAQDAVEAAVEVVLGCVREDNVSSSSTWFGVDPARWIDGGMVHRPSHRSGADGREKSHYTRHGWSMDTSRQDTIRRWSGAGAGGR
jgi:hypothetical protein